MTSHILYRRRKVIGFLAVSVPLWPIIAFAQIPTKRPLIAVLIVPSQATSQEYRSAFTQRLQELGTSNAGITTSSTDMPTAI
jgi:hypothetical protein